MPKETHVEFTIPYLQILDPEGDVDEDLEPDLDDGTLKEFYYHMKRGRLLDERGLSLSHGGRLGIFAPAKGQEAAQVGSASALDEDDWLVPSYRDHIAGFVRGLNLEYVLQYWAGDERGLDDGTDYNTYPISIPVGSQPLHAVGEAYAHRVDGEDTVVMTYFGDGATSTGDTQEALNFAGAWDVPVVFVCQNNQYAISVPRDNKQTGAKTLAQKAIGYGIEGIQVDGNDILAMYEAASEAVERARNGGGPTLLEAVTFRRGPHTTPDDPDRYRSDEEEEKWEQRDPIDRFERYLLDRDIIDEDDIESVTEEASQEVKEAVKRFENLDDREPWFFFDQIFEEKTWNLEEQEAFLKDELGEE